MLQPQDARVRFLEAFIAITMEEFKMSLRRLAVKGCRENVIYFILRFLPIARTVQRLHFGTTCECRVEF